MSLSDEMHRHCIQKFIGKMDPAEWLQIFQRFFPGHFLSEITKRFVLPCLQDWKWFYDPIMKRVEEIRSALLGGAQNIASKIAMVRALFDDGEMRRPT